MSLSAYNSPLIFRKKLSQSCFSSPTKNVSSYSSRSENRSSRQCFQFATVNIQNLIDITVVNGLVRFRHKQKWKLRWAVITKLSPAADCLHLQLYRDSKDRFKRGQTKASLSLEHFLAIETGFTLDKQSNTIAIICEDVIVILAFDTRERLIQWQVKITSHLGDGDQFLILVSLSPPKIKIPNGPARLHVHDRCFCLTVGMPPKLAGLWRIENLRRYGVLDNRFCFEAGSSCGKGEGIYVLITNKAHEITNSLRLASRNQRFEISSRTNSDANCSNFVQSSLSCMSKLGEISRSSTVIDPFDNYDVPKMARCFPDPINGHSESLCSAIDYYDKPKKIIDCIRMNDNGIHNNSRSCCVKKDSSCGYVTYPSALSDSNNEQFLTNWIDSPSLNCPIYATVDTSKKSKNLFEVNIAATNNKAPLIQDNYENFQFSQSLRFYENVQSLQNAIQNNDNQLCIKCANCNANGNRNRNLSITDSSAQIDSNQSSHTLPQPNHGPTTRQNSNDAEFASNPTTSTATSTIAVNVRRSSSVPCKRNRDSSSSNDSGFSINSIKPIKTGNFDSFELPLTGYSSRKLYRELKKSDDSKITAINQSIRRSKSFDPFDNLTFEFDETITISNNPDDCSKPVKSSSAEAEVPICISRKNPVENNNECIVPDSRSTSSGTSDMSDYFETISLMSFSSSETSDPRRNILSTRSISAAILKPRFGKEYQKIDRNELSLSSKNSTKGV